MGDKKSFLKMVQSDLSRYEETYTLRGQHISRKKIFWESIIFKPGFQAVLLYRISHWLFQRDVVYGAWFVSRLNQFFTGAEIEFNASIGPGMFIAHPAGIVIGRGTKVGAGVTIFQGVTLAVKDWHPDNIKKFPAIGDNCFFFAGSSVFGDVQIGENCVLAAGTIVDQDSPAGSLVKGNPGVIVPDKGKKMISSWRCANQKVQKEVR